MTSGGVAIDGVGAAAPSGFRAAALAAAFALCMSVAAVFPAADAAARDDDPLSLAKSLPGFDAERSKRVLAEHFAGAWRVSLVADDGSALHGRADVADDGDIALTLQGPDGEERYALVEADAMRYAEGTGPFKGGITARFKRLGEARPGAAPPPATLPVPRDWEALDVRLGDTGLELPIDWAEGGRDRIRVQLAGRKDLDHLEGTWSVERDASLTGGGVASWVRGAPRVIGVAVVDDQTGENKVYPFLPDGTPRKNPGVRRRTLVVYGTDLPAMADGARIESLSPAVSYLPVYKTGGDRQRIIDAALEKAKVENPADLDSFIVNAELDKGVVPGHKELSVDGSPGIWPLAFADHRAALKLRRSGSPLSPADPSTVAFFAGDIGHVELAFEGPVPFDDVGLRILRGPPDARSPADLQEIGVIRASRVKGGDGAKPVFRSDPFHLIDAAGGPRRPPDDEGALPVAVKTGDGIIARLLDDADLRTDPPAAIGVVFGDPSELGPLWKDALKRVAACDGDKFDGDPRYALKTSTRISRIVIGDFFLAVASYTSPLISAMRELPGMRDGPIKFDPSVDLMKGDHAAAILIRDQFVKMAPYMTSSFVPLANNRNGEVQALRDKARRSGNAEQVAFLRNNKAVWDVTWRSHFLRKAAKTFSPASWFAGVGKIEIPLTDTLDPVSLGKKLSLTPEEAEKWAVEQTRKAAQDQIGKVEQAIGRAQDAGDCNLEELMVVAGQKAEPVVARILPRLVRSKQGDGTPPSTYWVPDNLARGFVQRLHAGGEAVRALDQYAEIDDAYKAMAVALVTAGAGATLSGLGYGSAAAWAAIAGDVVDMGYFGAKGLDNYYRAEQFYDYARGAAPVMGDDILRNAEAGRQNAAMAAVGVIAPGLGGLSGLKNLRYFKNIQKGKALLESADDVLGDLGKLSETQRMHLAAYYNDLLTKARTTGLDSLAEADRAALGKFQDLVAAQGAAPPSTTTIMTEFEPPGTATSGARRARAVGTDTIPPPSGSRPSRPLAFNSAGTGDEQFAALARHAGGDPRRADPVLKGRWDSMTAAERGAAADAYGKLRAADPLGDPVQQLGRVVREGHQGYDSNELFARSLFDRPETVLPSGETGMRMADVVEATGLPPNQARRLLDDQLRRVRPNRGLSVGPDGFIHLGPRNSRLADLSPLERQLTELAGDAPVRNATPVRDARTRAQLDGSLGISPDESLAGAAHSQQVPAQRLMKRTGMTADQVRENLVNYLRRRQRMGEAEAKRLAADYLAGDVGPAPTGQPWPGPGPRPSAPTPQPGSGSGMDNPWGKPLPGKEKDMPSWQQ